MTGKSGFIGRPTDPFETPDAPEITGVSASILSADVTFTAPADTGGAAIDSYVITAKQSDGTSVAQTASSAGTTTITLTAGGTTTFGAQAFNLYGAGQFSGLGNSTSVFSGQELYAWGSNYSGQLGINNLVKQSSPVQVGSLTNWSTMGLGREHTAAVKTDGTLWTWGKNTDYGQLGLNDKIDRSSPVQVGALTTWSSATCGRGFTLAIKTDGTLWAWGRNGSGQLGNDTGVTTSSPVQVGSDTWSQVEAAQVATLAITTSGELYSSGYGGQGVLGRNTTGGSLGFIQVGALTNWSFINAGDYFCHAVKTDGTLWSWGSGGNGELGHNNQTSLSSPVQVGALTNWSITAGYEDSAGAVKTNGTLWTWGKNNVGQLGQGTASPFVQVSSPVQVGSLTTWQKIVMGREHTLATKTDGTLWGWGSGGDGCTGLNNSTNYSSPVQVGSETSWTSVFAGRIFSSALIGTTS